MHLESVVAWIVCGQHWGDNPQSVNHTSYVILCELTRYIEYGWTDCHFPRTETAPPLDKITKYKVTPIPVKHGILDILGYRFNNFTYITDASFISDESFKLIEGTEILVLNGLRYRPHHTHLSLQESVNIADKLGIKKAYFTHMTHDVLHRHLERELPSNMHPAYDGLTIEV